MVQGRSIVLNGDLGSGKSTVSRALAERLDLRRVAMGDAHRSMAHDRQLTTLQLNQQAERDKAVDDYVDQLQRDMASSGEQLVVDSRLGWHFFPDAFKVHLIVDPSVAASRVVSRPADLVEGYSSLEEAKHRLGQRSDSERTRFLATYGVDKYRMRNYDLVCDSTRASTEEIVNLIVGAFDGSFGSETLLNAPPLLLLDPARIYPAADLPGVSELLGADLGGQVGQAGLDAMEPLTLGYSDKFFYIVDGQSRLSAALRHGLTLVAGRLLAEADEELAGGLTAAQYFESEVSRSRIYEWEAVHGVELGLPPHLLRRPQVVASNQKRF